ncbi:MAG TPA: 23S rRNA (uracil(1939)-C(5))-methyltransferase RlmD [Candidatus Cybelea sp.]|nr:23S rRNA (uracil(1939)-C(5))-methyltransferase RlmD [Candidatus Cybelea sp.]
MTSSDTAPNDGSGLRAGDELEIEFTDVLANGQGVGRAQALVVFCFGPLAGERARVRIETRKRSYAVAEMLELLRESPDRTPPFCPVFGTCGGCQLQHLAYAAQLKWKQGVVRNALMRIGGLGEVAVGETIGMERPRAYRNKMALVVEHREAQPTLGFYRQRSHDIVAIDACPIVTPRLDSLLAELLKARTRAAGAAVLRPARHLVARAARSTDRAVLSVTTARPIDDGEQLAANLLPDLPSAVGLSNSYDPRSGNAILGRHQRDLAGATEVEETVGGVRYLISAGSFFQINVEILERIFAFMTPWLAQPGRIVDLYCGAGTFALYFARHGWQVYGVEESPRAIAEANANARRNALSDRARFETGRVEELTRAPRVAKILREADAVFLDPPRKGSEEAVLSAIAEARVGKVWYLSCDAATLARDLKFLAAKGYRLDDVQPFDMFPQTGHVETLVRLEHPEVSRT